MCIRIAGCLEIQPLEFYLIECCLLGNREAASCFKGHGPFWKNIWHSKLPNKIRIFCWKACRGILPTMEFLLRKGVVASPSRPLCSKASESIDHMVWGCKKVRKWWRDCPSFWQLMELKVLDFQDRISWVLAAGVEEFSLQFLVMSWLVWSARNQTIHGGCSSAGVKLWERAGLLVKEFVAAGVSRGLCDQKVPQKVGWLPLVEAGFKLNVDASVDSAGDRFGCGIIVRNAAGNPCLAATSVFPGSLGVEIAEVKALEEGLKLAIVHNLLPLVVESDASNVVSLSNNSVSSRAEVDNIVQDIKILCLGFGLDPISFVPRCCNKVAHVLAKKSLSVGSLI
ncbi:hypothetical protein ACOSQ2_010347 [Xanthoceras sorbifolium]